MRLIFIISIWLSASIGFSQQMDTTYLQEVSVYSTAIEQYAVGSKIEKMSVGNAAINLSDVLLSQSSVYLKTYGNNQLSTIAFRGTTASQTAVLWNGININSPTLGQTDFSLIPLFLFDEVSLQYGTASSLYGSDAIGGSVKIGHASVKFENHVNFSVLNQIGSFGRLSAGIKAQYGNTKWQARTKVFGLSLKNNFPYESPAIGYKKNQEHASVKNYGFDQQIHVRLSEHKQLSSEVMYMYNDRDIQPAVTNDNANETLQDEHIRLSVMYQQESKLGIVTGTVAYIKNNQQYTDDGASTVRSNQYTALVNIDNAFSLRSTIRYGVSYNYYTADSESYTSTVTDNRIDAFALYRYSVSRNWILSLNIRQSLYHAKYAPISPTLGTELHLLNKESRKFLVRAQVSRGFRVPTLNDRYWIPGGNPLIMPERAIHTEGGVNWSKTVSISKITFDVTYYRAWIDQMIVWLPMENSYWSPTNLQKVNTQGVELNGGVEDKIGTVILNAKISYAYTQSINKEGMNAFDKATVNKQLPYVPLHNVRVFSSIKYQEWAMDLVYNFTGLRYSTLDNVQYQSLKPYHLVDAGVKRNFIYSSWSFQVHGAVNNVLNVYYENLKNHAMPGRNYSISLLINF